MTSTATQPTTGCRVALQPTQGTLMTDLGVARIKVIENPSASRYGRMPKTIKVRIHVWLAGYGKDLQEKEQRRLERAWAKAAAEQFNLGPNLVYSRTAGCGCGCSPGFIAAEMSTCWISVNVQEAHA